jgi:hypothetical protein
VVRRWRRTLLARSARGERWNAGQPKPQVGDQRDLLFGAQACSADSCGPKSSRGLTGDSSTPPGATGAEGSRIVQDDAHAHALTS